jgi:hypothetical protein
VRKITFSRFSFPYSQH